MDRITIAVDSDFCSGNCVLRGIQKKSENEYHVVVRTKCDNEGTNFAVKKSRNWYYFKIKGISRNDKLVISILNTSPSKLYAQGFKPVLKIGENGEWNKVRQFRTYRDPEKRYVQEITYTSESEEPMIYIAFSYPFSYSDLENQISVLEEKFRDQDEIYFHSDVIIKSLHDRNLYCLTISSRKGLLTNQRTKTLPLPCHPNRDPRNRPFQFDNDDDSIPGRKPVYLLTARIHPCETPSSFICDGFIDFILGSSPEAVLLRDNFVFKILPMLNPDGVSEGNSRYNCMGHENLNDCFYRPNVRKEPVVFGEKEYMKFLYFYEDLEFFMDLHAHFNIRNAFIYGNAYQEYEDQFRSCLYPKIVSSISNHVDFKRCNFSYKRMDNMTGTARVELGIQSSLVNSYALEVNFHSGDRPVMIEYEKKHFLEIGSSLAMGLLIYRGVIERVKKKAEMQLKKEMVKNVRLWRGMKQELEVKYRYRRVFGRLVNEYCGSNRRRRAVTKKRITKVLFLVGGKYGEAKKEIEKWLNIKKKDEDDYEELD